MRVQRALVTVLQPFNTNWLIEYLLACFHHAIGHPTGEWLERVKLQ